MRARALGPLAAILRESIAIQAKDFVTKHGVEKFSTLGLLKGRDSAPAPAAWTPDPQDEVLDFKLLDRKLKPSRGLRAAGTREHSIRGRFASVDPQPQLVVRMHRRQAIHRNERSAIRHARAARTLLANACLVTNVTLTTLALPIAAESVTPVACAVPTNFAPVAATQFSVPIKMYGISRGSRTGVTNS